MIIDLEPIPNKQCVLTEDQLIWLKIFETINLNQWRCLCINRKMEWFYIGNWSDKIAHNKSPKRVKKEFELRNENLSLDRYYYWPEEVSYSDLSSSNE